MSMVYMTLDEIVEFVNSIDKDKEFVINLELEKECEYDEEPRNTFST